MNRTAEKHSGKIAQVEISLASAILLVPVLVLDLQFDHADEDDNGDDFLSFGFWMGDLSSFHMDDEDNNPRRYKWPWFVLAAAVLFVVLTIVWVSLAAKKVEQEREVNLPVPANGR
jgi:hypothetical protein